MHAVGGADGGTGEDVLVQLRDHAADAESDAADHSPLIGRTAGEADPGPCALRSPAPPPCCKLILANPAALQQSPGPTPPPPEAGPEPERLVARARDGDAAVG